MIGTKATEKNYFGAKHKLFNKYSFLFFFYIIIYSSYNYYNFIDRL